MFESPTHTGMEDGRCGNLAEEMEKCYATLAGRGGALNSSCVLICKAHPFAPSHSRQRSTNMCLYKADAMLFGVEREGKENAIKTDLSLVSFVDNGCFSEVAMTLCVMESGGLSSPGCTTISFHSNTHVPTPIPFPAISTFLHTKPKARRFPLLTEMCKIAHSFPPPLQMACPFHLSMHGFLILVQAVYWR